MEERENIQETTNPPPKAEFDIGSFLIPVLSVFLVAIGIVDLALWAFTGFNVFRSSLEPTEGEQQSTQPVTQITYTDSSSTAGSVQASPAQGSSETEGKRLSTLSIPKIHYALADPSREDHETPGIIPYRLASDNQVQNTPVQNTDENQEEAPTQTQNQPQTTTPAQSQPSNGGSTAGENTTQSGGATTTPATTLPSNTTQTPSTNSGAGAGGAVNISPGQPQAAKPNTGTNSSSGTQSSGGGNGQGFDTGTYVHDFSQGRLLGSTTSNKYHNKDCKTGAARIKPENEIWFNSVAEAEAAGYEPCGNCY